MQNLFKIWILCWRGSVRGDCSCFPSINQGHVCCQRLPLWLHWMVSDLLTPATTNTYVVPFHSLIWTQWRANCHSKNRIGLWSQWNAAPHVHMGPAGNFSSGDPSKSSKFRLWCLLLQSWPWRIRFVSTGIFGGLWSSCSGMCIDNCIHYNSQVSHFVVSCLFTKWVSCLFTM